VPGCPPPLPPLCRSDGDVMVLEDCGPHRSMPLSRGTVDGDTLVCAHHDARFDCSTACLEVPTQRTVPPGARIPGEPLGISHRKSKPTG